MNKKLFTLLAIFLVAISMASICASELTKENDFDGKFKMNITDNSTFEEVVDGIGSSVLLSNQSWSDNETVVVCYYENPMDSVLSVLKSNSNYMDDPTIDGNLTILEDTLYNDGDTASYSFKYIVGVSSPQNTTVFVACNDLDLAKEYANTIVFE